MEYNGQQGGTKRKLTDKPENIQITTNLDEIKNDAINDYSEKNSNISKKSPSKTEKVDKFDEILLIAKTKTSNKENLTETNIQDTPESKRPSRNKKAVERMGIDDIKISDTISPNKSNRKDTSDDKVLHEVFNDKTPKSREICKKLEKRKSTSDIKISDTISPNKSKFKLTPSSNAVDQEQNKLLTTPKSSKKQISFVNPADALKTPELQRSCGRNR